MRLPLVPGAPGPPWQHHRARLLAPQHQRVHGGLQRGCGGTGWAPAPLLPHTHTLCVPLESRVFSILVLKHCVLCRPLLMSVFLSLSLSTPPPSLAPFLFHPSVCLSSSASVRPGLEASS